MTLKTRKRIKEFNALKDENIAVIFRATAIVMMFSEITSVIAVLIDGIIASQGLGVEVYSAISLLSPFTSVLFLFAGFFSTGCNIVCSKLVGVGKGKEANEAFNFTSLLALICGALLILFCVLHPTGVLKCSGVALSKYPELNPYVFSFLKGYMIGIPAMILLQVMAPIIVMDGGKKLFTISSVVLCASDILGDLLNVYVFHGGAFGMGVATTASYLIQLLILLPRFLKRSSYFRFSLKACKPGSLIEIIKNGSPALVKKAAGAFRDIILNYVNLMVAVSAVAIAAKGIQGDFFQFLICIPTGLGRALITMAGIYYSANDMEGLKRLLSYSIRFGSMLSGAAAVITFVCAPFMAGLYTSDPEVLSLAVFSIRCMSVSLIFDTFIVLVEHYLQGIGSVLYANIVSVFERFVAPVASALILGLLFGTKGILASIAVSKVLLLICLILTNLFFSRGVPKSLTQLMFLPAGFGGEQSDNLYAKIRSEEEAIEISKQAYQFCLDHHTDHRKAMFTSLFVEEMAINAFERPKKRKKKESLCIDFRLFINKGDITFSLMDLSEQFDPFMFQELHDDSSPEDHIGIRIVTGMAKETRYYSTFRSNNLVVVT